MGVFRWRNVSNGQGHIAGRRAQAGGQDPGSGCRGRRPARGSARAARQGVVRAGGQALRRGARQEEEQELATWTRLSLSTLLPRWAKLDIGSIRRVDVKTAIAAIARPVLANQVDTCAVVRAGGLCKRSSRRGGLTAEPPAPGRAGACPSIRRSRSVGPHGLESALPCPYFARQRVIREMRPDVTLRYYSARCGARNSRLRAISTAVLTASSRLSV